MDRHQALEKARTFPMHVNITMIGSPPPPPPGGLKGIKKKKKTQNVGLRING
jgi:hypothetical protein